MTTYTIHDHNGLHGPFDSLNEVAQAMVDRYVPRYDPKVLATDDGSSTRMLTEQEYETIALRLVALSVEYHGGAVYDDFEMVFA